MAGVETIEQMATKDFAEHQITRRHEDELVRYYRCQRLGSWIYGFDVTFTPGWVFISGDIGHLALSRVADMLPWLRGTVARDRIDFRYVAEKAPNCIQTRQWDEKAASRALDRFLEDAEINYEERLGLYEFDGRWGWDHITVPKLMDLFPGPLEIDPTDWTPQFLWCVYGLRWFVRAYDEGK